MHNMLFKNDIDYIYTHYVYIQHVCTYTVHKHTHTHTHAHTHTHTLCIYIYTYTYIHTNDIYIYTYIHTSIHPSIHPSIHTYIHTYIHMIFMNKKKIYICIYIHILMSVISCVTTQERFLGCTSSKKQAQLLEYDSLQDEQVRGNLSNRRPLVICSESIGDLFEVFHGHILEIIDKQCVFGSLKSSSTDWIACGNSFWLLLWKITSQPAR